MQLILIIDLISIWTEIILAKIDFMEDKKSLVFVLNFGWFSNGSHFINKLLLVLPVSFSQTNNNRLLTCETVLYHWYLLAH